MVDSDEFFVDVDYVSPLDGAPLRADLVRRVANQRRELKNLHRLVEHLEGNGWGRRADAWEEGYRAGHSCVGADPACCREPNPYVPDVLRSLKSYPYGGDR